MVKLRDLLRWEKDTIWMENYLLYYRLLHYIPKYWLRRINGQRLNMEAQETDAITTNT